MEVGSNNIIIYYCCYKNHSKKIKSLHNKYVIGRGKRTAVIESKLRTEHSSEEKRKEHQKELAIALNEKAKERLAKQSSGKDTEKVRKNTVSYKSVGQMPRENEVKELKLYVGES